MINWIDILSPKLRDLHQDWTPACPGDQSEMTLPHPGLPGGLAVYRDGEGFILAAAS